MNLSITHFMDFRDSEKTIEACLWAICGVNGSKNVLICHRQGKIKNCWLSLLLVKYRLKISELMDII
jgi:hypothetical protein